MIELISFLCFQVKLKEIEKEREKEEKEFYALKVKFSNFGCF